MRREWLIFPLVLFFPTLAFAQCSGQRQPRPVEDMFGSDVVYPQERGEVQLEAAPSHAAGTTGIETAWEYGLTDALQIDGSWDGLRWSSQLQEPRVFAIGGKYTWMCLRGSLFHVSYGETIAVSAGGYLVTAPNLIVGRDLPSVHGNLFTSFAKSVPLSDSSEQRGTIWNTGVFVKIGEFRPTLEYTVTRQTGTTIQQVIPGLLWHSPDAWEIGAGLAAPISGISGWVVRTHVTFEFLGDDR